VLGKHVLIALVVGFIGFGVLPGCAAYKKCGLEGCGGDAGITAAVRARLSEHPALEPPNLLTVQTINRVVYLYGVVDTALQRDLAESVALGTPGVARVVNSIGISGAR
jgi:osmotically-inducible protein OsmY